MEWKEFKFVCGVLLGMGFLLLVPLILWVPKVFSEPPSFQRYSRGQISYADDQLMVQTGSLASGASTTFQVTIEQNYFIVTAENGDNQVQFSMSQNGPWGPTLPLKKGESFNLALERPSGSWVRISFPTASGSFRYIATGRSDNLPGIHPGYSTGVFDQ